MANFYEEESKLNEVMSSNCTYTEMATAIDSFFESWNHLNEEVSN